VNATNAQTSNTGSPLTSLLAMGTFAGALAVGLATMIATNQPLLAVAAGIAALGTVAAISSTEASIYAVITIGCMDGLIKGIYPGMFTVLLKDMYLMLALLHWIWDGMNGVGRTSLQTRVAVPAIMFILYCVAQMFNSENMSGLLALAGLRSWVIWIPIFFIAYDSITTRRQFERLLMFIAFISSTTGIYIIVQGQIGYDHLLAINSSFDFYARFQNNDLFRAPGSYVHPGVAGATMSYAAVVCMACALAARPFSLVQILLLISGPICVVAMAATGGRAPLVGAVFGVVAFIIMARRPQLLVGLFILAIIGLWQADVYVGRMMSARYSQSRLNIPAIVDRAIEPLGTGFAMLSKYPLGTGVASGAGTGRAYGMIEEEMSVKGETAVMIENEFGRAMKELGLPGFGLFIWLLWRAMTSAATGLSGGNRRDGLLAAGLVAGAINLSIQLMVGSALYLAPAGTYFWLSCALASRMPSYAEQERIELEGRDEEQIKAWDELMASMEKPPAA